MANNVVASPDKKEQIVKRIVTGKRTFRLDPIRSEIELNIHPEMAHVMERTATIIPKFAFDNFNSGPINGKRKTTLSRSIKTMPKRKNIMRITAFS
jgi:hypothetical protein